ncbi:MAG: hypothetical protein QOI76_2024 [Frankiales bacterium]|nr:hypothetical protein [Frankiales bacterium]
MSARRDLTPAVLALLTVGAGSGCAAQSCEGVYLSPGVHLDAGAWAAGGLDPTSITATICLAGVCKPATGTKPDDLGLWTDLPTGPVSVRVQLTAADGRTLDVSMTTQAQTFKPLGAGCGGRTEIALVVSKSGTLTASKPGSLG